MEIYLEIDNGKAYWSTVALTEKSYVEFLEFLEKTDKSKLYRIVDVEPVNNGKSFRPYYQTAVIVCKFDLSENHSLHNTEYLVKFSGKNPMFLTHALKNIWHKLPSEMMFSPNHIFITDDKEKAEDYSALMNWMIREYHYNLIRKKSSKCIWTINPEERHCKYCSKDYCLDRTSLPKKISKYEEGYLPVGKVEKLMLKK